MSYKININHPDGSRRRKSTGGTYEDRDKAQEVADMLNKTDRYTNARIAKRSR